MIDIDPSFAFSRLPSVRDLETAAHAHVFGQLEALQSDFLEHESKFRGADYKWPRDPLHNWSRVWEYPYVYHHIKSWSQSVCQGSLRVADIGSGVTFFPFALAKLGHSVVCVDNDPICDRDLRRSIDSVPSGPGVVTSTVIDDNALPFDNASFDVVYSISVSEHIPNFEETVAEIARILRPVGLCVLTFDISLDRHATHQLNQDQYTRLKAALSTAFTSKLPERTIHPLDMLTPRNSRFPSRSSSLGSVRWHAKRTLREGVQNKPKGLIGDPAAKLAICVSVLETVED